MNWSTVLRTLILLVAIFTVAESDSITAGETDKLIADIDKLIAQRVIADTSSAFGNAGANRFMGLLSESQEIKDLERSIANRMAKNPQAAATALISRLQSASADSEKLANYVLILGNTKDTTAVDPIIDVAKKCNSGEGLVKYNCLRALKTIGGEKSGEFLLLSLGQLSDPEKRYDVLDMLSEMQYEKALPLTAEILRKPADPYWWQPLFIFGKMGDKAVPFLIEKIEDTNTLVRANVVGILATWLISPDADRILREHYWRETDPDIRQTVVASVTRFCTDTDSAEGFLSKAAGADTLTALKEATQFSLTTLREAREQLASLKQKKRPSKKDFQKEYDRIFDSVGLEGDYQLLFSSSTLSDEPRLKMLRERVLQRNSDECFYDYDKINDIIVLNRLLAR